MKRAIAGIVTLSAIGASGLIATPAQAASWISDIDCIVRGVELVSSELRQEDRHYEFFSPPYEVTLAGNATFQYRIQCTGTKYRYKYNRNSSRVKKIKKRVNKTIYRTRVESAYASAEGWSPAEALQAAQNEVATGSWYQVYDVWYSG